MAIAPAGRFDYVAVIPADRKEPPWIMGQHARDRRPLEGDPVADDRLVGVNPTVDISEGTVTLTAASTYCASCQAASFDVAPGLLSCLSPEDILHMTRTGSGGVGLAVTRGTRVIVAVGAIATLPLEPLVVRRGPNRFLEESPPVQERAALPFWSPKRWFRERDKTGSNPPGVLGQSVPGRPVVSWEQNHRTQKTVTEKWPPPETWVEVTVGNETKALRDREEATIDEYRVFVERSWRWGIPGEDEAVAIYRSDDHIRDMALESAKRLAREIRLVKWSPHPPKTLLTLRKNGALCHAVLFYENVSVECRFLRNGEVLSSQRFEYPLDAIRWARSEREKFQRHGWKWQR